MRHLPKHLLAGAVAMAAGLLLQLTAAAGLILWVGLGQHLSSPVSGSTNCWSSFSPCYHSVSCSVRVSKHLSGERSLRNTSINPGCLQPLSTKKQSLPRPNPWAWLAAGLDNS